MLLMILLAIPLIGVVAMLFTRNKSINIPLITSSLVLLVASFVLKNVFQGEALTYTLPLSSPFIPTFNADHLSVIFVLLSAFLWVVISIYTPKYMEHEGKTWQFEMATIVTMFAILGIFLSGDLMTLLMFFELMTIASYFWVIHRWNKEAIRAGYFYLFFSIVGGLLIAMAIAMLGSAVDVLPAIGSGMVRPTDPKLFAGSIALFIAGFGIKAGMVPLHLWLPYAHSVSPTPGSALLSGLLIKVGAYGLIRTGEFVGWGTSLGLGVSNLGSIVIIIGSATMLLGVLAALIQSNAKKLLAYHSVSQMGYILLGLGVAFYLGSTGGLGLSGAIYHIINHALFKIALFLGVGIIYIHTGETNLYKLGGLWRRFPVTAVLMLLAVLGITGAPGLNGYASKSLLHHGISLAAETGAPWLVWVERLFLVVGVGTAASFAKLFYLMFLGKPTKLEVKDDLGTPSLQIAMSLLIVVMVAIGLRPEYLLYTVIEPAVLALGMENIGQALSGISFWEFKDIFDMVITLGLGVIVSWAGLKSGAFHWSPPAWLTIEGLVTILAGKASIIGGKMMKSYAFLMESVKAFGRSMTVGLNSGIDKFDGSKSSTIWGVNLVGISADLGILFFVLGLIIGLYTLLHFALMI